MITYFDNTMTGAPVLNGTAGALLGVLDACLVTGFGTQTASSLSVTGTVATLALPAVHGIPPGAYVRIAGATPAGLNGDWKVVTTTSQGLTFATTVAAGTATGTITAKHAPLGWAKEFSGTNKAAYRSADVTGTRMRLRVDDAGAYTARVVGYESMSDVDTGIAPFPTAAQLSGGLYWPKSVNSEAATKAWIIIGDERLFYLYVAANITYQDQGHCFAFGDFASLKTGDPYSCMIGGHHTAVINSTIPFADVCMGSTSFSASNPCAFVPRHYNGIGSAQPFYSGSPYCTVNNTRSGNSDYSVTDLAYPNGPDNALITAPVCINSNLSVRGFYPGAYHTPQACQGQFNTGDLVAGSGAHAGKTLLVLRSGGALSGDKNSDVLYGGTLFLDLTGPWR